MRQLVDDKYVASLSTDLLQVGCQNLLPIQACCKLFQQIVTSLQMTSCNKPDFDRLGEIVKFVATRQLPTNFWLCQVILQVDGIFLS